MLVNVWIPLDQVTRPLVLMDRRTLDARRQQVRYGLPTDSFLEREESTRVNDIWTFLHDPAQRWYFNAELDAYALFRAALAHLLSGGDAATANGYLDRAKAFQNTLHAQLAASFQAAYAAKGEVGTGCAAANEDVRFNEAEYALFWEYGTDNPAFDPSAVCPF